MCGKRAREMNPDTTPHGPERKPWRDSLSDLAVAPDGQPLITPPSADPLQLSSYPAVHGVSQELYQLPSSGLTPEQVVSALRETRELIGHVTTNMLGFQVNEKFSLPFLSHLCHIHLDNEGSPFNQSKSGTSCDTKWLERNVLDYFASLWHAKWPHDPADPDTYWGYILPIGVTEANMFSLCTARDYLTGNFCVTTHPNRGDPRPTETFMQGEFVGVEKSENIHKPVAFFSTDSHYSVMKAIQVCDIPCFHEVGTKLYPNENPLGGAWPMSVPCEHGDAGPGNIDIEKLAKLVDFFSGKGHPVIVVFNYGSTFKGAYDDIKAAEEAILPVLKKNGMYEHRVAHPVTKEVVTRKGYWFHVDAALAGLYMSFVEMGHVQELIRDEPGPVFDFRLESVCSIAMSVSKHMGGPWPCGIYLSKTGLQLALSSGLEPTFSCSRNGHNAAVLWSNISSDNFECQTRKIARILSVADYAEQKLRDLEKELGQDLWVSRTRLSLAIYFKRPNPEIFRYFSLSSKILYLKGEVRVYCHIYVMNHVTRELIDRFVDALRVPGAFPTQDTKQSTRK